MRMTPWLLVRFGGAAMLPLLGVVLVGLPCRSPAAAAAAEPSTAPAIGQLAHIQVDAAHHQIRVDCQAVKATYPLEFVAVRTNTNEYEALVRTDARPSDLHLALLMLGLQAGAPLHYDPSSKTWVPPTGPLLNIRFEYDNNGKTINVPAYAWMRDVNTKQPPTDYTWCFAGSQILPNRSYAADATGSLIGLINNPVSVVDVPSLRSRALDARQWERNPNVMPPTGTPVTMIITPAAVGPTAAGSPPAASAAANAATSAPARTGPTSAP